MNEKLPYEEQLTQAWDDLPLPNEEMAWKDMKRRLEKDDDDRILVPPPKRGCGLGTLLIAVLLIGGFWLLVRPEKWLNKKNTAITEELNTDSSSKEKGEVKMEEKVKNEISANDSGSSASDSTSKNLNDQNKVGQELMIETKEPGVKNKTNTSEPLTIEQESEIQIQNAKTTKRRQPVPVKTRSEKVSVTTTKTKQKLKDEMSVPDQKESIKTDLKVADSGTRHEIDSTIQKEPDEVKPLTSINDSSAVGQTDTFNVRQDSVAKNQKPAKNNTKEKRPVFFSAGIGLHQQIPVAGQEWTTYSSLGRKGILSDYIPSVNFRMEKQDRWFLQTEFRYGAPQHTKKLTYDQVITFDTSTQSTNTISSVVKKTFYHQALLTFDYYVTKNWSVGGGVQLNRFYSAVAEEDLKRRSFGSQTDTLISKNLVKISNDSASAFAKSWWQGNLQSQFQWKRFSIGARYSFGLQPYIRFTLPGQPLTKEKNSSLQVFLRYELWRSKKLN